MGGTALAATIGGDHQSLYASLLLGSLAFGLSHSLLEEIKRQARRTSATWSRSDSTNAVVLGAGAEVVLLASILVLHTPATRAVGLVLAVAYAAACGYFVTERRRAVADAKPAKDSRSAATGIEEHFPTTLELGVISPPSPASAASAAAFSDSGQPDRSPYEHMAAPAHDVHATGTVVHRRHPAGIGHAPTAAHPTQGRVSAAHPTAAHPAGGSTRPLSPGQATHSHPSSHSHRKPSGHGQQNHPATATQPTHEHKTDNRRQPPPGMHQRPPCDDDNRAALVPQEHPTGGRPTPQAATQSPANDRPLSLPTGHDRPVAHAPAAHVFAGVPRHCTS